MRGDPKSVSGRETVIREIKLSIFGYLTLLGAFHEDIVHGSGASVTSGSYFYGKGEDRITCRN